MVQPAEEALVLKGLFDKGVDLLLKGRLYAYSQGLNPLGGAHLVGAPVGCDA
jgi:hypothetical protein